MVLFEFLVIFRAFILLVNDIREAERGRFPEICQIFEIIRFSERCRFSENCQLAEIFL